MTLFTASVTSDRSHLGPISFGVVGPERPRSSYAEDFPGREPPKTTILDVGLRPRWLADGGPAGRIV